MTPGVMSYLESMAAAVSGDVLEVGSFDMNGSPRSIFSNRARFPTYVGIDLTNGKGVDLVMSCHSLKFAPESFDIIVDAERLEHDTNFFQSYREIYRVLRPGGHVITTTRAWGGFHPHCEPYDYWRFTDYGLQHVLESVGLEVLDVRYGEFWHATRDCKETGGCVEHPKGGEHKDEFAHAVYAFSRKEE